MNPILLDLGIIKIYWYSVTMFLAMFVGVFLFYKSSKKSGLSEDFIVNLLFYGIIFGLIGARVYYVLFNLSYYLKNPIEIIEVWNGGLAIHGGLIGGFLWFLYYSKKNNVSLIKLLDMACISVIIGQVIGRWGNFFNQEAHGGIVLRETLEKRLIPNFIINGMNIDGVYYEPTFLYESLWNFIGFIILIVLRKKCKLKDGVLVGIYFVWYSFIRFFIEGMRTDSLMFGSIRIARFVSVLLFVLGLFLIFYKRKDTRVNRYKGRGDIYE